ncbi:hypothetical protein FQA39_LY11262 [Lamprigera yunnana]|nr:hypothetical protein FQA39_LY11262 [Lamprigera yunnana]
MPFVQRVIEPKFLSCTSLFDKDGKPRITDNELEAVTNNTLSNAIRQLASLALAANDIFVELAKQLQHVTERSDSLKRKIGALEERVSYLDPKKVSVPESDICTFSRLKEHYKINHAVSTNLFDAATRPKAVQTLYEAAAKTPITIIRQMDRWRRDGHRCSKFFVCTPVLGARRRKIRNIDIETRMPSTMGDLRRWTSTEAVGDLTIAPDCPNRIVPNLAYSDGNATDGTIGSDDEALDHKLPSPEEQLQVIALKFPAEIVAVDISGRAFNRMSLQRRSLLHAEMSRLQGETLRLRTKSRKPRTRRRNTLAGTDQKEIEGALMCDNSMELVETRSAESTSVFRSKSSEPLPKKESEMKKSHFHSLKQWGKNRLKMLNKSDSLKETEEKQSNEDLNIYETVNLKRKRGLKKIIHERNPSCSSSEKSSVNLALTAPLAGLAVKLRESSVQRRLRRVGGNRDEPHSSSGNWSASSESGRASIGSEITNTTQPKSTSVTTSNNSLNLHPPGSVNSKRKFNVNTSGSSSITSEGTLTPDIHDFHEDGETSSVYSCDTEGYYTSFHMDSGLKTLKEEDAPVTPLHSTTAFGNVTANCTLTAENEYELFGKGSTSTTASSAGTVCTTLKAADSQKSLTFAPAVPERKSSLSKMALKDNLVKNALDSEFASDKTGTVKRSPCGSKSAALVGTKQSTGDLSPDSGHNTSSSPIESSNSPNGVRSGSEFEFSECSDMEGSDRIERIRAKTTINSSRIPSMCVITPPHSDDEGYNQKVFDNLETDTRTIVTVNPETGYATLETVNSKTIPSSVGEEDEIKQNRTIFKSTLLPLNNALGKLKTNFSKTDKICFKNVDDGLGDYGDYVTIADVKKNNENLPIYAETVAKTTTEYVSLNELPCNANASDSLERKRRQGARVTLSADGKVVYSSDSLRRRNGAHTTFEPGPYVKETATQSSILAQVRSISSESRPLSPQFGKVVIKASAGVASPTSEIVRVPPSTIVTPSARTTSPKPINSRGAYVHMQDARGILSSPQEKGKVSQFSLPKVNRTDSYRIANRPIVRKILSVDLEDRIEREITAELWRERINYPPSVSPKLCQRQCHNFGRAHAPELLLASSNKIIPLDSVEHRARVLSASITDTEIW